MATDEGKVKAVEKLPVKDAEMVERERRMSIDFIDEYYNITLSIFRWESEYAELYSNYNRRLVRLRI